MLNRVLRSSLASLFCLGALALAGPAAEAAPIAVFSTGVNNSGALAAAGTSDLHYTVNSSPNGPLSPLVSQNLPSEWAANTATSRWISPTANGSASVAAGIFNYQTVFSLQGLVASTAVITGSVAADDQVAIFLNGVNRGTYSGPSSLSAFSLTSGFVAGVNTLIFQVVNSTVAGVNPTGLQVNIASATATSVDAVPEPASLAMLGIALGGGGVFARARRRISAV